MNATQQTKLAVVVGGSGQIGRVIVKRFLDNGIRVAVVSRGVTDTSCLETLKGAQGQQVHLYQANVGDEQQVQESLRDIANTIGRMSCLVYAPGIEPDCNLPLSQYPTRDWEETFRVYVTGLFLCYREAFPGVVSGDHFVVVSSAITRFGKDSLPPLHAGHYAAAKAAVSELCKWVRRELHERGGLLSRISPGAVDVPFHRNAPSLRRPSSVVPVDLVASKIVNAVLCGIEVDEELLSS
jgi:NAD(P)-dependent dehydrogenase (short-subunit alcohol dehydrogenase family)